MAPSADVRHRGSADARVVTGAVLIQHVFKVAHQVLASILCDCILQVAVSQ